MPSDRKPQRPVVKAHNRRTLVRVFPTTPGAVPVRLFAHVLRELITAPNSHTQAQVEARSGVPSRTIYRILKRVDRSVSFEVADALLTALDANSLWHDQPLKPFFEPAPPRDTLINPITFGQEAARNTALTRQHTT